MCILTVKNAHVLYTVYENIDQQSCSLLSAILHCHISKEAQCGLQLCVHSPL